MHCTNVSIRADGKVVYDENYLGITRYTPGYWEVILEQEYSVALRKEQEKQEKMRLDREQTELRNRVEKKQEAKEN